MIKLTINELRKRSQVYFEKDATLQKMIVTEDGNFFYPNGDHYAFSHARTNNIQAITITKEDAYRKAEEPKKVEEVEEVEEKEQVVDDSMTVAQINSFAEEKGITTLPQWDKSWNKKEKIQFINNLS